MSADTFRMYLRCEFIGTPRGLLRTLKCALLAQIRRERTVRARGWSSGDCIRSFPSWKSTQIDPVIQKRVSSNERTSISSSWCPYPNVGSTCGLATRVEMFGHYWEEGLENLLTFICSCAHAANNDRDPRRPISPSRIFRYRLDIFQNLWLSPNSCEMNIRLAMSCQ